MNSMTKPAQQNDFRIFREAVLQNKPYAEKMLKEKPALLNQTSSSGETVLHYSAIEGATEVVEWLLKKGAKINTASSLGVTPLMHAIQMGHSSLAQLLISSGADWNAADSLNGDSVLHYATRYGRVEICKLLVDLGASLESLNDLSETPSDVAMLRKKKEIENCLIKNNGN